MVLRKKVRRQSDSFASRVARVVPDARRQRLIRAMITGPGMGWHVHLTEITWATGRGTENVHAPEKRLSGHLRSQHWSMKVFADWLLGQSAAMVGEDSLIVADLTDLSKSSAQHLEGLGWVRDASSPEKRTVPGYVIFETYVRVRRWQFFPLVMGAVRLLEAPQEELSLVTYRALPRRTPLMLLVSPRATALGKVVCGQLPPALGRGRCEAWGEAVV